MPQHHYITDSSGDVDLAAYTEDGHRGPICFMCGTHVCVKTCEKHRGRLVPLDVAVCKGSDNTFFVVYEQSTRATLGFHLSRPGAESNVRKLLATDRKAGKVHDHVDPYPIVEEALWI